MRTAFLLILGGESSYTLLSQRLQIPRTNLRFMLANPIYTGWRVYGEKRDPSANGYVRSPNGRQGYRRKIPRAPDEVIRTKVLDGIVSEADFNRVQQIIELKRQKHWRSYAETPNRYTYNGFLTCDDCGSLLYTHTANDEYFVCKSRNTREARLRAARGLVPCSNPYMMRKKLEPKVDVLLGEKLLEPDFLGRVVDEFNTRTKGPSIAAAEKAVIAKKLAALEAKRTRVMEAFYDGVIDKPERDRRTAQVDAELSTFRRILLETMPAAADVPVEAEIEAALEPFAEWEFLERDDKRKLLATLCPEIRVERYVVKALMLNLVANDGHEVNRNRAVGASLPARCAETLVIHPKTAHHCGPRKPLRAAAQRRLRSVPRR